LPWCSIAIFGIEYDVDTENVFLSRSSSNFGSPTIFVGNDMYFGNDRMPLIREALERVKARAA
jgi:2-hydroxychromene-2-carboxylate isomerase